MAGAMVPLTELRAAACSCNARDAARGPALEDRAPQLNGRLAFRRGSASVARFASWPEPGSSNRCWSAGASWMLGQSRPGRLASERSSPGLAVAPVLGLTFLLPELAVTEAQT